MTDLASARIDVDVPAAELAALDRITRELAASHARAAREHARQTRLLAEAAQLAAAQTARIVSRASAEREMPVRRIAAELATAVRQSDRTLQRRMDAASRMVDRFPATVAALDDGRISRGHADLMLDLGTLVQDDEAARAVFEDRVLARCEQDSVGRAREFARRLAERLRPRSIDERHRDARAQRGVRVVEVDHGVAELIALLPTALAHGIHDRLTQQVRALRDHARDAHLRASPGERAEAPNACAGTSDESADASSAPSRDGRTLDQTRADLLADLLLTAAPSVDPTLEPGLGAIRAHVQLTLPAATLVGAGDHGAEVGGHPIDAASARRLAARAPGWDRLLLDPVRGTVRAVDRYSPTAEQRRMLHARDPHCRFPGCRMPAYRSDIDHTHDHTHGGPTALDNLAVLCRRHHSLKHATDWSVRQLPGGDLEWTSPTGRRYRDEPPPRVAFLPDEPPPF